MHTNSKKNDVLFERLKVLCEGYSTGRFEELFPLLSEDCVFESQWVLTPHKGKADTIDYLTGKGVSMRKSNCSVNSNSMQKSKKDAQNISGDNKDVRFNLSGDNNDNDGGYENGFGEENSSKELGWLGDSSETKAFGQVGEVGRIQQETPNTPHTRRIHRNGVSARILTSSGLTAEQAERWAHKEEVDVGTQKLASHHMRWYIIEKFENLEYGYQIVGTVKAKEVNKFIEEVKRRGSKINKARKRTVAGLAGGSEGGHSIGLRGHGDDSNTDKHNQKAGGFEGLASNKNGRRYVSSDGGRITEQNGRDRKNVEDVKFNISTDSYSTQKIIEAKALASDDSELIEAAKENTKQVRSFVRMNSDKQ